MATREIKHILSAYIDQRNNFHKENSGIAGNANSLNGVKRWDDMITSYHSQLFGEFDDRFNLAEMEAFSELVNARLNYMRMNIQRRG